MTRTPRTLRVHTLRGGARHVRALRARALRPHPRTTSLSPSPSPRPHPRPRARLRLRTAPALALAAGLLLGTGTVPGPLGTVAPAHADSIRDQQWALSALHARRAWRTTDGTGTTVAVLDTGVDADHPDLRGQVLEGRDLVGFGARPGDRAWARHGTAMAGIIAGRGHGPGRAQGVLGIAPGARVLPVRVILEEGDPGRAEARDSKGGALAEGIRWAADQGADVINLSLGDDSASAHHEAAEDEAVQYALAKGSVVVASAGNGGEDGDRVSYPAAYPGVIAVTAVDRDNTKAPFSTRHWYATVSAPGVDVVIADPDRNYYEGWGTSAAAAFVSGSVALLRAARPDLSPAQIKTLLADTAAHPPAGGRDDARGHGLVDPAAALAAAARLAPRPALPAPAPAPARHFGPGPAAPRPAPDRLPLPVLAAAGTGSALLLAALALGRRARRAPGSGTGTGTGAAAGPRPGSGREPAAGPGPAGG